MPETKVNKPLPDMPKQPANPKKTETLFVAYDLGNTFDVFDAVVYGTKLEALEYAMDQDPAWKVVQVTKGQSLRTAITAKDKS